MFDITIMLQYFRYRGQEPAEIDREAIKRYLTTDESWVQHRWSAIRRKCRFPFSISFHDGVYREEVLEGWQVDDTHDDDEQRKDNETTALLVKPANRPTSRSYGTQ
jgi:hypothetical protein